VDPKPVSNVSITAASHVPPHHLSLSALGQLIKNRPDSLKCVKRQFGFLMAYPSKGVQPRCMTKPGRLWREKRASNLFPLRQPNSPIDFRRVSNINEIAPAATRQKATSVLQSAHQFRRENLLQQRIEPCQIHTSIHLPRAEKAPIADTCQTKILARADAQKGSIAWFEVAASSQRCDIRTPY